MLVYLRDGSTQFCLRPHGPTSPSADPIPPGAWQGSHWSANVEVTGMTRPGKKPTAQAGIELRILRSRGDRLVGLVVKASASRVEDPGFESLLMPGFFRGRDIPVT